MLQRQSTERTDDTNALASGFETIEVSDDVLQHYHHLEKIGHGAQGTMLKALDDTDHPVAIKVFDFGTVREWKDVELFEREIDVLKNLNIDGVPRYIETIKTDKVIYLVEEYIDAQSIEKQMKNGRNFTVEECETILERTARILTKLGAHTPPIVHRDIKPANLLVDNDLNVWLVDFGVVMNTQQTFSMTFAGTAGYVAPEQLYGKATSASDIFSLGATMLHIVSHVSPSDMNLKGISPDFDRYIPKSVPQWLSKTIRQMMTVNPDERPQNGQVLLDLLQENKLENKKSADSRETPRNIQTKTKHAGNIQYTDYSGFNGLVSLYKSYETITTDDNSHPLMYQDGQMSSGLTQENKSKSQANAQSSQTPQNTQSTEKTSGNIKKYTDYLDLKKSKALLKLSQTIRNDKKLHPLKYRDDKIYPKQLVDSYNPAGMVMTILVSCVGAALLSVSIPAFSDGNVLLGFFMIVVSFFCFVPLFCFLSKRKRYCEMIGFDNSDINTEIQILVQNALTGKAEAQYNLARRYDSGFELQQDKYLALEWYKLAAAKGHISSRKRIVELYNELADHIS